MADKKTVCPITRTQFAEEAGPVTIIIRQADGAETEYTLSPRTFATESMGWNLADKVQLKVGDVAVRVQIGINLIVVGSKDLPAE